MKTALRAVGAGFAGVLLLLAVGVGGLLWWSLPAGRQTLAVPGLSAPVRIGIDADGVPRIEAATARDGAAALGFMHARDRMFQMELMRRAASGRLSEVVGPATLRLDRFNRTLGLRLRAEAELPGLDADTRGMLEAYAAGVNAWIAARGRFAAPEFIPLGAPEPWTAADSLLWGKTMALYLSGNWRQEMLMASLRDRVPPEQLRALWPVQAAAGVPGLAQRLGALVPGFPAPFTLPDEASNEWAVDGRHSATGAPLLAGDPHLAFSMPGIWYLARISTPQGVLAGATAPGVPFLVIGHNGRIAWTFTTAGADTQDVFVETPSGTGYLTPDGVRPFATREERIRVRGAPDVVMTVRTTRHGPVLSDLDGAKDGPVLAVAMASLEPGDTAAAGLLALNRAGSVAEAGRAAAVISDPVQNLLVADRAGIGMFTTGRVPVRRSGTGVLPVPGADGRADWAGFASGDALPHSVDPPDGVLVNANERVPQGPSTVFMGQDWFGDWRAQRIRALLAERTTHGVNSFARMQVDVVSAFARGVLPRLLRTEPRDDASRAALSRLRRWDGAMGTEANQPLLFNGWMRRVMAALLERQELPAGALGAAPDAIGRALGPEEARWCGTDCPSMLSATLAAAAADTAAAAAGDAAGETWGAAHPAVFAHPVLGRLPVIGSWFRWSIPQPGDDTTVFRGSPGAPGWESVHGPSYRGVYDLADLDRSVFALAPGQSGHPLRRLAGNLLERWRNGTSLRLGPAAPAAETVELTPEGAGPAQ